MRYFLFIILIISSSSFNQAKEKAIFVFEEEKKNMELKKGNIYVIDNLTFRKTSSKVCGKKVTYKEIQKHVKTVDQFKKDLKRNPQKYPDVYSNFDIFIYTPDQFSNAGYLTKVERIWQIDSKTIN